MIACTHREDLLYHTRLFGNFETLREYRSMTEIGCGSDTLISCHGRKLEGICVKQK